MQDLSLIRSMLFTPADRPDRFAKAAASGADGAVLDLEDGVGLPAKHDARAAALAFLAAPAMAPQNFVWALRLNHVTTVAGLQDLLALRGVAKKPAVVLLPKTESVTEVDIAIRHLAEGDASPAIVALIESGRGAGIRRCGPGRGSECRAGLGADAVRAQPHRAGGCRCGRRGMGCAVPRHP